MLYAVRPMQLEDVLQVTEIDREAFPTLWPPTSFKRELLHNKTARYLVVCEETGDEMPAKSKGEEGRGSRIERLVSGVRRFFGDEAPATTDQRIVGLAGMWFMSNEAHLTTIAVRQAYWRGGIGELLLISVIELAMERNAQVVTLEVRASNLAAQALYQKYGFAKVRVRCGYYTDNREDALVMSTERITSASYQGNFQRLKRAHSEIWGCPRS